ncbi:hypothetical protein C8J57DRAFT_286361 [Mycena rebaudengoi]|nr:hypothetical protein C8J57DRAFT_286361 [Mycena rebaudengoi]
MRPAYASGLQPDSCAPHRRLCFPANTTPSTFAAPVLRICIPSCGRLGSPGWTTISASGLSSPQRCPGLRAAFSEAVPYTGLHLRNIPPSTYAEATGAVGPHSDRHPRRRRRASPLRHPLPGLTRAEMPFSCRLRSARYSVPYSKDMRITASTKSPLATGVWLSCVRTPPPSTSRASWRSMRICDDPPPMRLPQTSFVGHRHSASSMSASLEPGVRHAQRQVPQRRSATTDSRAVAQAAAAGVDAATRIPARTVAHTSRNLPTPGERRRR